MTNPELLLAFDLGSTHLKGGLFLASGAALRYAARPLAARSREGSLRIEPIEMVEAIRAILAELTDGIEPKQVRGIGICSMAESGLLVDAKTLAPASWITPWFDRGDEQQVARIRAHSSEEEVFSWSGIRATFKCPLAKILWLRDSHSISLQDKLWLSAADYLAALFTGQCATDPSLAGRTLAYDINRQRWRQPWLEEWELDQSLFPRVVPAGQPVGFTNAACQQIFNLPTGIPVSVAGHDHVCAAAALSACSGGAIVDSMGTAETLLGGFPDAPLGSQEYRSGLFYGAHVLPGSKYWLGTLSTSGGALEWVRSLFGAQMTYAEIEQEVLSLPRAPGGLVFIPYLSGSGAPHSNPSAAGAWLGLKSQHGRAHLLKAILEGTACEIEFVRQAVQAAGIPGADRIIATGGGTRNSTWLQIKANVTGCPILLKNSAEAALTGAAMAGGLAGGFYDDFQSASAAFLPAEEETILPDPELAPAYRSYYEQLYLPAVRLAESFSENLARM